MSIPSCVDLDRISPTVRPKGANSGTQRWRDLLFVHWHLDPAVVRPLIPAPIELDLWDGKLFVGVVPFAMQGVRPSWLPNALALDFLELNVRTYVHYRGRPAVWFFSLDAASWLAVQAARTGWALPYFHATMRREVVGSRHHYTSTRRDGKARLEVEYEVDEALGPSTPGTLEHFLLERYLLLSARRGAILEGQVHHPPYFAHRATLRSFSQTMLKSSGMGEVGVPTLAHFSPGVDVEVFGPSVLP